MSTSPHRTQRRVYRALAAGLLTLSAAACGGGGDAPASTAPSSPGSGNPVTPPPPPPPPGRPAGTAVVGRGSIATYAEVDPDGTPRLLALLITPSALELDGAPMLFRRVGMPALGAQIPFDHVEFNWNPTGHGPAGVYHDPHIDAHFFLISTQERATILDPQRMLRAPDSSAVPAGYRGDPEPFAEMGVHFMDHQAPEFTGGRFSHTMIMGYHDGAMIFQEPMVTRSLLLSRQTVVAPIRQPARYPRPGYYPTRYRIDFDETANVHRIALEGFVLRP